MLSRVTDVRTRPFTIIAQDLTVKANESAITAVVDVPEERLMAGPRGHRVSIVDYDATRRIFYEPAECPPGTDYGKGVVQIVEHRHGRDSHHGVVAGPARDFQE